MHKLRAGMAALIDKKKSPPLWRGSRRPGTGLVPELWPRPWDGIGPLWWPNGRARAGPPWGCRRWRGRQKVSQRARLEADVLALYGISTRGRLVHQAVQDDHVLPRGHGLRRMAPHPPRRRRRPNLAPKPRKSCTARQTAVLAAALVKPCGVNLPTVTSHRGGSRPGRGQQGSRRPRALAPPRALPVSR